MDYVEKAEVCSSPTCGRISSLIAPNFSGTEENICNERENSEINPLVAEQKSDNLKIAQPTFKRNKINY